MNSLKKSNRRSITSSSSKSLTKSSRLASPERKQKISDEKSKTTGLETIKFDLIDPSSFQSNTMKELLGLTTSKPKYEDNFVDNTFSMTPSTALINSDITYSLSTSIALEHRKNAVQLSYDTPEKLVKNNNKSAQLIYNTHFSGINSIGASGMTILEEMIDLALKCCDNSRKSGLKNHSRGAVVLDKNGVVYSGCSVSLRENDPYEMTAERVAITTALSNGVENIECLVVCTDTMKTFPAPSGLDREFLRGIGVFPVILVNCELEARHTSTIELYPFNVSNDNAEIFKKSSTGNISTSQEINLDLKNVGDWKVNDITYWLKDCGLSDLQKIFEDNFIDGSTLLQIDDMYARDYMKITNPLKRRKLCRHIDLLKRKHVEKLKESTLDELDEYIMYLESHRLKLIAKLKAVFDRFDSQKSGSLNGLQVEQSLLYMNRPVDSTKVAKWLSKLKEENNFVDFPEYVSQYSDLFASEDPDITTDNPNNNVRSERKTDHSLFKERSEAWNDEDDAVDNYENIPLKQKDNYQSNRYLNDKDLLDEKFLTEMKTIFDRFAVDTMITAPEACQALTEAGLTAPRREMAQYLRSRRFIGGKRNISFYEFLRAFAALREGPKLILSLRTKSKESSRFRDTTNRDESYDPRTTKSISYTSSDEFYEGMFVEAKYRGKGKWYSGKILKIREDDSIDVIYDDGEKDIALERIFVRKQLASPKIDRYEIYENVLVNFQGKGRYYDGKIISINRDGTYDIELYDNRKEFNVPIDDIQKQKNKSRINNDDDTKSKTKNSKVKLGFQERDKVEANYRGRGKWYPGKISRDRGDGTYDIDYDDGENEMRVPENMIRLIGVTGSRSPNTRSSFPSSKGKPLLLDID